MQATSSNSREVPLHRRVRHKSNVLFEMVVRQTQTSISARVLEAVWYSQSASSEFSCRAVAVEGNDIRFSRLRVRKVKQALCVADRRTAVACKLWPAATAR